jgi:hypothetical protein
MKALIIAESCFLVISFAFLFKFLKNIDNAYKAVLESFSEIDNNYVIQAKK